MPIDLKNKTVKELSGILAHEINNPLAIVMTVVSQLQESVEAGDNLDPVKTAEQLKSISDAALRISKIIRYLQAHGRE